MNVFTVEDYVPVPTQEFLLIEEFKALFDNKYNFNFDQDKSGRYKKRGLCESRFLFFYCDYKSEFAKFPENSRKEESLKAAGLPVDYTFSPKLEAAIDRYNSLKTSRNLRLLKSANKAIDKLQLYFDSIDFAVNNADGSPKFIPKDVIANIANLGKVLEGLDKLEEAVAKEESPEATARGEAEKGRL
jgi:hypothetical protein